MLQLLFLCAAQPPSQRLQQHQVALRLCTKDSVPLLREIGRACGQRLGVSVTVSTQLNLLEMNVALMRGVARLLLLNAFGD